MQTLYNAPMRLTLNAEEIDVPASISLADLIEQRGLADAACATEVNKALVPKADRPSTQLDEGDCIEIVTLVGGG